MIQPYYDLDGVTVYLGDCLEVMHEIGQVDHVITDPPYSPVTHAGARSLRDLDAELVTFDSIDEMDLLEAFSTAGSITKRWMIATVDWRHMNTLESVNADGGAFFRFVRFGVWVKPNGAPQFTGDRPATGWEAVAIMHSLGGKMRWNRGGHHAVWTFSKENTDHPTGKPEALARAFVSDFTDPGDLILDPFAGSLTTAVAAKHLGRRCIAIEREERYIVAGLERLRQGVLL